ncbi:MFS transporter [Frankia sp. CcI49]|uniref:MFS transporter n=1 Tax=Frankia sp. CcI49 TaxID=1745382 RepID=UPI0009788C44|nr:MFS transporter [Frankia sp. CcI49]ONH58038.1 MFS transporter [Frankia sp. CcI49]
MRKWLPLLTVCLGTFMLLIDVTIVNVALPDLVTDLGASLSALQWVIDAYALSLAALLLGVGSIADIVGHRRMYIAGLGLFAVSSLLCGLAPGPGTLVAARAVQGVGAAAMFATTFALLNSSYTGRDRGTAYGVWGAVSGASSAIGPILGGLLTEGVSWRWIFFVNLPVSVIAIGLCLTALSDTHPPRRVRVDLGGIATFTGAAGALTYALIRANEDGWSDAVVWSLLAASAVLLAGFVAVEARVREPLFDLALLRDRRFVAVLLTGLLLTFAAFAAFTYSSIWLQSVLGMGPLGAGLTGIPLSVAAFAVSAGLGRILHERRPDRVISLGLLLIGLGALLVAALVHGSARWPALLPGFAVIGLGVGLVIPILGSVSMSFVPPQRGGMAAGAVNTARQLGYAIGIAVLGNVFAARAHAILAERDVPAAAQVAHTVAGGGSRQLLGASEPTARQALDGALHAASVGALQMTFVVAGTVGVVASLAVAYLMRPHGGGGGGGGAGSVPAQDHAAAIGPAATPATS